MKDLAQNLFVELELREVKIRKALHRGFELTRDIARALIEIEQGKLYEAKDYGSFRQYVIGELMDYRSAVRFIAAEQTMALLEHNGIERLPANESQAAELARLPEDNRVEAWQSLISEADEPTVIDVRRLVEKKIKQGINAEPDADIEIDLDGEQERRTLSEQGERALDRIREICGDSIAKGIEHGTIDITESDIIHWAEQRDDTVRNLAYYIIDLRWRLNKALAYEDKIVDDHTTIKDLLTFACARGGRIAIQLKDPIARITVEYSPN